MSDDIYGQLRGAYEALGRKFTSGDIGASQLSFPDLMQESKELRETRQESIQEYLGKAGRKDAKSETNRRIGDQAKRQTQKINKNTDGILGDLLEIGGDLTQGVFRAKSKQQRTDSQMEYRRANQEFRQELRADQQYENLYLRKVRAVGNANIDAQEGLAANVLKNTDMAAELYVTLSVRNGGAVSKEQFLETFGDAGMTISQGAWSRIEDRAFERAEDMRQGFIERGVLRENGQPERQQEPERGSKKSSKANSRVQHGVTVQPAPELVIDGNAPNRGSVVGLTSSLANTQAQQNTTPAGRRDSNEMTPAEANVFGAYYRHQEQMIRRGGKFDRSETVDYKKFMELNGFSESAVSEGRFNELKQQAEGTLRVLNQGKQLGANIEKGANELEKLREQFAASGVSLGGSQSLPGAGGQRERSMDGIA